MLNKLESAVERYNMLKDGDSVTVALSGGADSTALLHAMLKLSKKYGIKVDAAHVNHMLRGDESDRDEQFVREMCARMEVPLSVGRFDIKSLQQPGESCEECARGVRYDFLSRCANGKIATAHTADDNLETVIFNITRGAGIKGACGIPPVRDNIIRPLIMCSRLDIERYCEQNQLDFVTDSTNLTDDYTRNRIRHGIVPVMREINPSVDGGISRFTSAMRDADNLIASLATDAVIKAKSDNGYDCKKLADLHRALLPRAVQLISQHVTGSAADSVHTELMCNIIRKGTGKCQLQGGFFAEVSNGNFIIYKENFSKKNVATPCCEFINKTVKFGQYIIKTELFDHLNVNKSLAINAVDYDKIKGNPILRTRNAGDSIKLTKRPRKSIKKLLCELKIPQEKRDSLPLLADDNGVICILGIGCDSRVAVNENTKKILIFSGVESI